MRPPALLLLGLLSALPLLPALRAGEEPPPSDEPPLVTLSGLRADPPAHLGQEVQCVLQLGDPVPAFNPYLTRFGPGEFLCFQAWSDERFLWDRAAFEDPAPYVFARRGTPAADLLAAARPYQRFRVRAVPREVFLGEPWIEVLDADRMHESVSEGTILHAARGLELLAEGNADLARGQLQRAKAGFLPEHARAELERLIESCAEPR